MHNQDKPASEKRFTFTIKKRSEAVARPAPKALNSLVDPIEKNLAQRQLEINQLVTRFKCPISDSEETVALITLKPSDPDFPFELESLELRLCISKEYPAGPSSISVLNQEIPENLKRGIQDSWISRTGTLLQKLNWLDRELENLLVEKSEKPMISFVDLNQLRESLVNSTNEATEEPTLIETTSNISSRNPHIGTSIRLSNLALENISLVKCLKINLIVSCNRCKQTSEIRNLETNINNPTSSKPLQMQCSGCNFGFTIRFRGEMLHQNSNILGFFDLDACKIFDLLPFDLVITCANCSVEKAMQSVQVSRRNTTRCIECHSQSSIQFDQPSIANLGGAVKLEKSTLRPKKIKDTVSLVVGEPLNKNGTCKHYKKSFRWLRFPCCGRLYPCDTCHEELKPDKHEMVLANRMVCGFCSRESAYAPQKTCVCGHDMTCRSGGNNAFWNGGKGTRDHVRMSRKDSRKYKSH